MVHATKETFQKRQTALNLSLLLFSLPFECAQSKGRKNALLPLKHLLDLKHETC
jgi:hypothetical protein